MLEDPDGLNPLTETIIGCGVTVHREFGAGLFESVYARCFILELRANGLVLRQRNGFLWCTEEFGCTPHRFDCGRPRGRRGQGRVHADAGSLGASDHVSEVERMSRRSVDELQRADTNERREEAGSSETGKIETLRSSVTPCSRLLEAELRSLRPLRWLAVSASTPARKPTPPSHIHTTTPRAPGVGVRR
jgi:PD-(D/E)XK nuclease superfamily protein